MSHINTWPQSKYKFSLFDNSAQVKTVEEVQKLFPKAKAIINLWYFSLKDQPEHNVKYFDHQNGGVMLKGKWVYEKYDFPGLCIDKNGNASVGNKADATWEYTACSQACYIDGKLVSNKDWPVDGVTYSGFNSNGDVVTMLSVEEEGLTGKDAVRLMLNAGCKTILRWDGSYSTRGYILGKFIKPLLNRPIRGWLIIEERETANPVPTVKKKVMLDPGHGIETAGKCAPDKSYYEHEFNLDMAFRIKKILERHNVEVSITRSTENDVSLANRVNMANKIKDLDLFASLHSNASGNGVVWTEPSGYGIYTSMAGVTAGRNIAAGKLIARAKEAGTKLWGNGLFHDGLYVLKYTNASAILIEHGFHTNKAETELLRTSEYRQKLAEIDSKGILDFLGIKWVDEVIPKPWYAEHQEWAITQGISDGTRPLEMMTRAEAWAMFKKYNDRK